MYVFLRILDYVDRKRNITFASNSLLANTVLEKNNYTMFNDLLRQELLNNSPNYFTDNFDYYTFGKNIALKKIIVNKLKRVFFSKPILPIILKNDFLYHKVFLDKLLHVEKYVKSLEFFYNNLASDESKELLIKLIAFRLLGYVKVRLPLSSPSYWNGINEMEKLQNVNDWIELKYFPWKLYLHEIKMDDAEIKVYINSKGAYTTFVLQQYIKTVNGKSLGPHKGDHVLDLGGCYGDTALFFSHLVGNSGKVYSFEFIPGNLNIFRKNLSLNPSLKDNIEIIERPVWSVSGKKIYYKDAGAGSKVSFEKSEDLVGETLTISIDSFVEENGIKRIDFIKSDIESAEPEMLKGAVNTIKRFTPTLAISIYHNMSDFTGIIKQISDLNLGYKFYLGHYTIYASETILYAIKG